MPVYIRAFCQGTNRFSPIKKLTAPIAPVQIPVADGFRQMMRQNLLGGFQIGYRTRNLQDAVISPGRKIQACHGIAEKLQSFSVGHGKNIKQTGSHLGIVIDSRLIGKASCLNLTGTDNALTDDRAPDMRFR